MQAINRPARLRRAAFFAQFARQGFHDATRAILTISPDPGFQRRNAKQVAHQLLTRIYRDDEMAQEIANIMSPEEVKTLFSTFARDETKPDQTRLRAGELMAKVHALLTERNINENTNKNVSDESPDPSIVAMEALRMLREAEQSESKLAQVVTPQQDGGV